MRTVILGTLALSLTAAAALAQTTSPGGSSTPGTTTPGTTSPGTTGVGKGAPALVPRPSGPVTPNRSSTDIFPPSRLLPPTEGAVTTQQTPGGTGTTPGTSGAGSSATGQSTPGATGTPAGTSTATDTSGAQSGGTTATTTDGQSSGGTSTGPTRPIPPNSQTSSGSGQAVSTRTGKNALNETVTECMKLWDSSTHMTKQQWSRTCHRVQGRLDQVTKQILTK